MYKMPLGSTGPKSNLTKKILGPTAPRSNLTSKILGSVAPKSKRAARASEKRKYMDTKRWSTPADVMEDLLRASGRHLPAPYEACLLRGERPPPRPALDDEELPRVSPSSQAAPPPDLCGITNMIRMVQDYGGDEQMENITKGVMSSQSALTNDYIVISKLDSSPSKQVAPSKYRHDTSPYADGDQSSPRISDRDILTSNFRNYIKKLNPNVQEFVPKSKELFSPSPIMDQPCWSLLAKSDSEDTACHSTDINANDSMMVSLKIEQQKSNHVNTTNINVIQMKSSTEEKLVPVDQCQIERDELAAMLQKNINSGVHQKRNVDLLLRNCDSPAPALRLFTPRFYENCAAPASEPDPSAEAMSSSPEQLAPAGVDKEHTALTAEESLDCGETVVSETRLGLDDASGSEGEGKAQGDGDQARVVRDAIHKVTGWLNNEPRAPAATATATAPALYLGPIAFKRKERAAPQTPPAPAPAPPAPCAYVPGARSAALGRQFEAQAQARAEAEQRPLSIYDKLERDLKQRDEALRKRAEKQRDALRH